MTDSYRARLTYLTVPALLLIISTGCSTMTTTPTSVDETPIPDSSNQPARWPLRFKAHYFGVATYSTYGCEVIYAGRGRAEDPQDELQSSSEHIGSKYPDNMKAGWGPIRNFPPPAKVTWRSKDGTPLEAEVDIGEIFKDELIQHHLTLDEVTPATLASDHAPGIILEVNDRTINVYMRATLWTKELQIPGNPLSNQRDDLIKVYSRTY